MDVATTDPYGSGEGEEVEVAVEEEPPYAHGEGKQYGEDDQEYGEGTPNKEWVVKEEEAEEQDWSDWGDWGDWHGWGWGEEWSWDPNAASVKAEPVDTSSGSKGWTENETYPDKSWKKYPDKSWKNWDQWYDKPVKQE